MGVGARWAVTQKVLQGTGVDLIVGGLKRSPGVEDLPCVNGTVRGRLVGYRMQRDEVTEQDGSDRRRERVCVTIWAGVRGR